MDILVIGSTSTRAPSLTQFLHAQGHVVISSNSLRPGLVCAGAVVFDQPDANTLETVREASEALRFLSVPVLVIRADDHPLREQELRDAGADRVCGPGTSDEMILEALSTLRQAQPLEPELHTLLAEPLIAAVRQTLTEMVGMEVVVRSVYRRTATGHLGDIAVVLPMSNGILMMSFNPRTAESFARRLFANTSVEVDPTLVHDCAGEIVNVVAGQAKALFAQTPYRFSFSTPTIFASRDRPPPESVDALTIAFDSEAGPFALQRCPLR